MSKIDLNLQFLFNEYDLIDRYKKAAELGYKFVELQNPYSIDLNELKLLINDLALSLADKSAFGPPISVFTQPG